MVLLRVSGAKQFVPFHHAVITVSGVLLLQPAPSSIFRPWWSCDVLMGIELIVQTVLSMTPDLFLSSCDLRFLGAFPFKKIDPGPEFSFLLVP